LLVVKVCREEAAIRRVNGGMCEEEKGFAIDGILERHFTVN